MGEQKLMSAPFLQCRDISLNLDGRHVLQGISFHLDKRQRLVIAGETGSGKSSLMKIIAGLAQPDTGDVYLDGQRIEGPHEKLVPGHPSIAYLSQHFELPKFLRVEQVFSYANLLTGESAENLYRLCQVDHLLLRRTDELSGGEKQRIALARLLTTSPSLLLLDEPFSHLDMDHKKTLKQVVDDVSGALDITCIMVSHSPGDTLPWADKILVLRDGLLVQEGPATELYLRPRDEYVAGLFGHYSIVYSDGEMLLLRPEQIDVTTSEGSGMLAGVVTSILFHGAYSLVTIRSDRSDIDIVALIPVGQTLYKGQRVWYAPKVG